MTYDYKNSIVGRLKNMVQWRAIFNFHSPVHEKSIVGTEGIEFNTENVNESIAIKGFSIITPSLEYDRAKNYANEKANRIFDYMSAIHNYAIKGYLSNMTEHKPLGEKKTGIVQMNGSLVIHKSENLDFSKKSFEDVFNGKDEKFQRQLSHFRNGLEVDNIITKILEFYKIIEDEYNKQHPFIEENKYIRHLMSHPELTYEKHKESAIDKLGKQYFDPSNPEDIEKLKKDVEVIKNEARKIIKNKISV